MKARWALPLVVLCACAQEDELDLEGISQAELVRVPAVDPTAPTLGLRVWEQIAGGGDAYLPGNPLGSSFAIKSKQSKLGIRLSGIDSQSGIHQLTVYCRTESQDCATCAWTSVPDAVCYQDSWPLVPPNDWAEDQQLLDRELDLTTVIPQTAPAPNATRKVGLGFHAVVTNNYQVISQTNEIYLTYTETAPPPCFPTCNAACIKGCPSGRGYLTCKQECRVDCTDACQGKP